MDGRSAHCTIRGYGGEKEGEMDRAEGREGIPTDGKNPVRARWAGVMTAN